MKATLTTIIALLLGLATLHADDTELVLETRMKRNVKQVQETLTKYDNFNTAYKQAGDRQARVEMLHRIAKRMRKNAEQLARSAEMLETQLLLESAEQPADNDELISTKNDIKELRREIQQLRKKLATKDTDQKVASID